MLCTQIGIHQINFQFYVNSGLIEISSDFNLHNPVKTNLTVISNQHNPTKPNSRTKNTSNELIICQSRVKSFQLMDKPIRLRVLLLDHLKIFNSISIGIRDSSLLQGRYTSNWSFKLLCATKLLRFYSVLKDIILSGFPFDHFKMDHFSI